jgi:hypothetical protein
MVSPCLLGRLGVPTAGRLIPAGVLAHGGDLLLRERTTDLGGGAGNQGFGGDLHPLEDHRSRRHQGTGADACPVEQDGTHADKYAVSDVTAMEHRPVAHGNAVPDMKGKSWIGMQDAPVLDVASFPHLDTVTVPT